MKKLTAQNKKKPVLIVIAILAVIGLVFFLKKGDAQIEDNGKNSHTSKAETYTNKDHNLSFLYPNDWGLETVTDTPDFLNIYVTKEDRKQEMIAVYTEKMYPSYSINIVVEPNPKNLTAGAYLTDFFGPNSGIEMKPVKYGGLIGVQYEEGAAPASGPATAVVLTNNEYVFRFVYSALATKETHEKFLDVFEDLLDSSQFE